jgi:hypothetical protein
LELFHNIFSFMEFDNSLECRLVSKTWHDKVSLLSHLYVYLKIKGNTSKEITDDLIYWKKICKKNTFKNDCILRF